MAQQKEPESPALGLTEAAWQSHKAQSAHWKLVDKWNNIGSRAPLKGCGVGADPCTTYTAVSVNWGSFLWVSLN